jgi:hypothetical protein
MIPPVTASEEGRAQICNLAVSAVRVVFWRGNIRAGPCVSLLLCSVVEGVNPVCNADYQCIAMCLRRVELFGNAALNGW